MSPFENDAAAMAALPSPEDLASTEGVPTEAPLTSGPETDSAVSAADPSAEGPQSGNELPEPAGETLGDDVVPEGAAEKAPEPAGEVVEPSGPPTRIMAAGTKLQFGSSTVTLVEDTVVTYDEAGNEQHFAATCQMTGNYDVNARLLEKQYDLNGRVIEG